MAPKCIPLLHPPPFSSILPRMTQAAPQAPTQIPESFFDTLEDSTRAVATRLGSPPPSGGAWQPQKIQYWYDSIIDWMFANPGGNLKECAAALGKAPVTIQLIVRSDLFKARYSARRALFNQELDHRLVGKLAKVAELGLDLTLEVMEKKRDSVPLPLLNEITSRAMDRLGYGPGSSGSAPPVAVHVHANASAEARAAVPETVTPAALERARKNLALLQASNEAKVIDHEPSLRDSAQLPHEVGLGGSGSSAPLEVVGADEAGEG